MSWRDARQSDAALSAEKSTSQGVFALPHPRQTVFQRNQSSTVTFTQKIKLAAPVVRCCPLSSKGFAGFLTTLLSSVSQQAQDQSTGNMGSHHISPEMLLLAGLMGWQVVDFGGPQNSYSIQGVMLERPPTTVTRMKSDPSLWALWVQLPSHVMTCCMVSISSISEAHIRGE